MKILFLLETLQVGGAETSLLHILPRLRAVEPTICHIYQRDELKAAYEAAGVRVVSLNLPPKYRFVRAVKLVEELLRRERTDLIVTTLIRADIVGRIAGKHLGIPVIGSFVSDDYSDSARGLMTRAGRVKLCAWQLLDGVTAIWAAHFVANSHSVKSSRARSLRIPPDRVTVIHRGRDSAVFTNVLPPAGDIAYRDPLGIQGNALIILNLGRLVPSKGQAELIEAFRRVVAVFPEARLLIAGEGPYHEKLRQVISAARLTDVVQLLGRRDDIPDLLALSSVFAFPSHHEGHPGAVVEAMFAGKPIVASDIAVHHETLSPLGGGQLTPVGRPDLLAEALLALLQDRESA
jgi:glycosyltransferase involved in cell wall biosynthesis